METSPRLVAITGAGSGIGRALCRLYAREGCTVVALDRDLDAATTTAATTTKTTATDARGRIVARRLDVTDAAAFAETVACIERELGPIDMLVNNAGIGIGGEIRDHTLDDFRLVMEVNYFGVLHGVMAAYPRMLQRGKGTIVNVASVAGLFPLPGEAAYVASKYAVVGFTRVLAAEAAALGVRVVLVCPGKVETPIYAASEIRGFDKEKALGLLPAGITPEDCAARIADGVAAGEDTILITRLAKAMWGFERLAPSGVARFGRYYINRMRAFRHG